jgi:RHS repeat-associated protein
LAGFLESITGGDTTTFRYDALGLRTQKVHNGVTRNYLVNYAFTLPSVCTVNDGANNLRYYVWLPNGRLLHSIEAAGGARHFYHFDEAGNTTFLTDDAGNITDSYGITPFGEIITSLGSTENPFLFAGAFGAMRDETGLYYMRARYYDASTGRFLSRDPVGFRGPRGSNPYQYAYLDPLRFADPVGRAPVTLNISSGGIRATPADPNALGCGDAILLNGVPIAAPVRHIADDPILPLNVPASPASFITQTFDSLPPLDVSATGGSTHPVLLSDVLQSASSLDAADSDTIQTDLVPLPILANSPMSVVTQTVPLPRRILISPHRFSSRKEIIRYNSEGNERRLMPPTHPSDPHSKLISQLGLNMLGPFALPAFEATLQSPSPAQPALPSNNGPPNPSIEDPFSFSGGVPILDQVFGAPPPLHSVPTLR